MCIILYVVVIDTISRAFSDKAYLKKTKKSYASALLPVASGPRVIHVQRNNRYRVCLEVPGICYRSVARPWSVNSRKHVRTYGIPYRQQ